MQINNITNLKYNAGFGKKYIPPKTLKGTAEDVGLKLKNVMDSKYSSNIKLGEIINTGIVQGDDAHYSLWQNDIKRSEVAAILTRMMNPELRISFWIHEPEAVYDTAADTEPVAPEFIEDVTRMYLTHTNVTVQGILDRIEIKNK